MRTIHVPPIVVATVLATPGVPFRARRIVCSWHVAVELLTGRSIASHMRRIAYGGKKGRASRRKLLALGGLPLGALWVGDAMALTLREGP